jgi:hypothetical protein
MINRLYIEQSKREMCFKDTTSASLYDYKFLGVTVSAPNKVRENNKCGQLLNNQIAQYKLHA